MNTNPDETTLALWLDDELQGEELAAVNAWAARHPEQLAAREETRHWRKMIASAMPATAEPPYAEFFNGRIDTAIRRQSAEGAKRKVSMLSVLMPLAACAGMAFTFWLGGKANSGSPEIDVAGAPRAIPVEPIVYTPERGVKAEWFASSEASATVIVLDGVDAIPDSMNFSATVSTRNWREIDATAGIETEEVPSL
jgi:anti-sigma factor RsiW